MFRKLVAVSALAALLAIQGCSSDGDVKPEEDAAALAEAEARAAEEAAAAEAAAAEEAARAEAEAARLQASMFDGQPITEAMDDPASPLSKRVFYFGFDLSTIEMEDKETLETHARFLAEHPDVNVTIEGHADERGSREYNLALGERRAKAVERILMVQGAAKEQAQMISFGEERPVAMGHDEESWRLNRRVELIYSGY